MYRVEMTEIGRSKAAEVAEMEEITHENLYAMVYRHLVSSDVSFSINGEETEGKVYAGFRPVGKFKVTKIATAGTVAE